MPELDPLVPAGHNDHCYSSVAFASGDENTRPTNPTRTETRQAPNFTYHDFASLTGEFVNYYHSASALQLCLLFAAVYLLTGTIIFSFIFAEFTVIDSLYFSVVSFTTVGYGDLRPVNETEQLVTTFYILVGVTVLGVGLGIIGENLLEAQERIMKPVQRDAEERWLHRLESGITESTRTAKADDLEASIWEDARLHRLESGITEATRTTKADDLEASIWEDAKHLIINMGPLVAAILFLALVMGFVEGWSVVQSIYFCVVSTTTVGYGDFVPKTQAMKLVAVFFLPIAIAVMANFLGRVAGIYMERKARQWEKEFFARELTFADLAAMDTDHSGGVSYGEFLSFMLVAMQKVNQSDADRLKALFHSLDADNSGELEKKDLILLAERKRRKSVKIRPHLARSA